MQIIALWALKLFWQQQAQAETPLRTWYTMVSNAVWTGPADVKQQFGGAVDFVADNRIIFDIGGNKYRLIVRVSYEYKAVQVKFIGTHAEYDKIDPVTCKLK
ncbi:MAG TPA: type II toxin-antitoxin system HigB family toxin [Stellaceae bacterium]|jgi:mRNA interferase HigB|nr:type II toxin-antitoxin system HigB family toxin [Stellaceae bacterium]